MYVTENTQKQVLQAFEANLNCRYYNYKNIKIYFDNYLIGISRLQDRLANFKSDLVMIWCVIVTFTCE